MNKHLLAAALIIGATGVSSHAIAQTAAMDVGPIPSQSGPNFVNAASDVDVYEMKAAQLAVYKAQRDDVKAFAKSVLDAADTRHKALLASLHNDQRTIKTPTTEPSADRGAMLKLLSKSPRRSFDNLFLQQSVKVARSGWSVSKGYALDGTDDSLKQVATTAVPSFEQEVTQATALLPAALAGAQ